MPKERLFPVAASLILFSRSLLFKVSKRETVLPHKTSVAQNSYSQVSNLCKSREIVEKVNPPW